MVYLAWRLCRSKFIPPKIVGSDGVGIDVEQAFHEIAGDTRRHLKRLELDAKLVLLIRPHDLGRAVMLVHAVHRVRWTADQRTSASVGQVLVNVGKKIESLSLKADHDLLPVSFSLVRHTVRH